jgi:hypothetical protein
MGDEWLEQGGGYVVYAVIIDVLQHVQGDAFARPGQAADDD